MKVLIADDTRTNRILAARILERGGHAVKTVENGQEAIEQLSREDFDLVLMDVQMPVMGGIEAAMIIRSTSSPVRCHDVPILAVSAGGEPEDAAGLSQCLNAGMNGYLNKPVRAKEFLKYIERYGRTQDAGTRPAKHETIVRP